MQMQGRAMWRGLALCMASASVYAMGQDSAQTPLRAGASAASASDMGRDTANAAFAGPFAGGWEACAGARSPDECHRYQLVQRGERICGTWSYVASGREYEGRLIARATSATAARRTHVCGRAGSMTTTECDAGWQRTDTPLHLCNGRLGDMPGADGRCVADHLPMSESSERVADLLAQDWVQACLSMNP
ncbi:hypothetical protein [Xanthomonas sp. XNM01]|uniref:hypothetical protein n=1 Tax=Xanthomonas sp. XNM01 TaxID=2769289 RepID=UPI00177D1F0A|nr:hypothetical protein [Xanthomonas sp. XNM01]MBD9369241.1 hypothetical protein [Xanthomonas sp. XNM01]